MKIVVAKNGGAPLDREEPLARAPKPADETPISTSGVVTRAGEPRVLPRGGRARDSEPPSYRHLTPYQARLDVEMDDTAVSKVRDPSVSISLDAEAILPTEPPPRLVPFVWRRDAVRSIALGTVLGVLLVVAMVVVVRALGL